MAWLEMYGCLTACYLVLFVLGSVRMVSPGSLPGSVFTTFDLFQGSSNVVVSCCNPAALCEHASVYTGHGCPRGQFQGSHPEQGCGSLVSLGTRLSFSWPCTGV